MQSHLAVTWLFPAADEQSAASALLPLVPPPAAVLTRLLTLAQRGDILALKKRAATLQKQEARYASFAGELLRLAESYQVQKICDWLVTLEKVCS